MVMNFPQDVTDDTLLAAVSRWARTLSTGDYAGALNMVVHAPHWTPELLEAVITNWGDASAASPGPHRVTPEDDAAGDPTREVDRFGNGRIGIWYDLPIDGEWSDLTATFSLVEQGQRVLLKLEDVHVM